MARFEPLLRLHFSKKKKIVLKEDNKPTIPKPESSGFKPVVWKCATSIPDVKIVLYNLESSPINQVSI